MFPSRELYGCVDIVVTVGIAVVAEIDIVRPINPAARIDFGHFPAPLHIAVVSCVRLAIEEIVHHVGCIPCDRMAYILCFIYLYILQCSDFGVGIEIVDIAVIVRVPVRCSPRMSISRHHVLLYCLDQAVQDEAVVLGMYMQER